MTSLRIAILERTATISVVGQGYVGATLAAAAAEAGFTVFGIDIDEARLEGLRTGADPVPGVDLDLLDAGRATGRLTFTSSFDPIADSDVTLICVPTPLRDHAPDMRSIESASAEIAIRARAGTLIVLESTTYPGTTEELVLPILETSGLKAGDDFHLAYSPERIDPGNAEWGLANTPKVVGGLTESCGDLATVFYEQLCEKVVTVSSCKTAETAKLLENTYRHVNIALVNELAMLCHEMGIDVWEVIHATATKPFGFTAFTPGPGVGGHCIPVDPTYLTWKVRTAAGQGFRIVETAEDVNARMPAYVVTRIGDALNDLGKATRGSKVLVLGVTYKPGVGDIRESPALEVVRLLLARGADVSFCDPFVEQIEVSGRVLTGVQPTDEAVADANLVALLTPHADYDIDRIIRHATVLFDARNAANGRRAPNVVRL